MAARYSIGIDLGTTNCSLAYAPLEEGSSRSEIFPVTQWNTAQSLSSFSSMPSFLYRLLEEEKKHFSSHFARGGDWIPGRFARDQMAIHPGRVVSSAKSWLCTVGIDHHGSFLPWGQEQLKEEEKISPVEASAHLLRYLRESWEEQFAQEAPFQQQIVTVTVPASFDAAAQRLTLEAAEEAGFPAGLRLLEEPQAAFCRWLEIQGQKGGGKLRDRLRGISHVLVVDVGGGTSDFSLFEVQKEVNREKEPVIRRVAVSDHILLGGDNIDLAMAHVIAEVQIEESLSSEQWGHLLAQCRAIKEETLSLPGREEPFPISIPGRGSGLFKGAIRAEISPADVAMILFEGFYPECEADEKTEKSTAGLREFGLPYARDHAVTRHLAEFLQGRSRVDAVLFNGGSLTPVALQDRILSLVEKWQGSKPVKLSHSELDLAVARGAASHGWNLHHRKSRIEFTAPRSLFLEVDRSGKKPSLVCLLPKGTPCDQEIKIDSLDLELITNQPVGFQVVTSNRLEDTAPGEVLSDALGDKEDFHRLPLLETIVKSADGRASVPVQLSSRLNSLGLLEVECVTIDSPEERWPLKFTLSGKAHPLDLARVQAAKPRSPVTELAVKRARQAMLDFFRPASEGTDSKKITANRLFSVIEQALGQPRQQWDVALLRNLWETHSQCFSSCYLSAAHEETWMNVAGYLLRPGYGVSFDEARIDRLWKPEETAYDFPGKRIDQARYLLWRRVSGGLNRPRQEKLATECLDKLRQAAMPSAELIRLSGALERISLEDKKALSELLLSRGKKLAEEGGYSEPCWVALMLLLNRVPLYGGPETVLPAEQVITAFESLRKLDWEDEKLKAILSLFLRAARMIDDPHLDLPRKLQKEIVARLRKAKVEASRLVSLEIYKEIRSEEQGQLLGEAPPPGLILK